MADLSELLQQYFRGMTRQLLATSNMAVAEHSGLKGGHREQIIRIYLRAVLPKRFEIGRGMIYGMVGHSHECDIVIWDSANYPTLPLADHNVFFGESVRGVLEVKSNWSSGEFLDIKEKTETLNTLLIHSEYNGLLDQLSRIRLELLALQTGQEHDGMLITPERIIATGALVYRGGSNHWSEELTEEELDTVDFTYPDLLVCLEDGILVRKVYEGEPIGRSDCYLEVVEAGEDALLLFTASWLGLLNYRSVQVEDPLYIEKYIGQLFKNVPMRIYPFPTLRPFPGRIPVWKSPLDYDDESNIE